MPLPASLAGMAMVSQILGYILGKFGNLARLFSIEWIKPQHVAVILDGGTAARRRYDDRIEAAIFDLAGPGIDIAAGLGERFPFAPHVVDERAAASLALRHDDLDAKAGQQFNRRLVDARVQHRLGAA